MFESKITVRKVGNLKLQESLHKSRPAHLSAASGLVRHGEQFFVVADDELHLGIFAASDLEPYAPLRLLPGKLPRDSAKRKKKKPDFEVLAALPAAAASPHGALLVMGSGSRSNREIGLHLSLDGAGMPSRLECAPIDFAGLYAALRTEFGTVNIEGAVVQQDRLLLLQRGNKGDGINAIVALDLATVLHEMRSGVVGDAALRGIRNYALGAIANIPLGFSDATLLPDARLIALAVAEDTDDAYLDGATAGSCLCTFDLDNNLLTTTPLDIPHKAEGIAVWSLEEKTLAFVTDADDAEISAALYIAHLHDLF